MEVNIRTTEADYRLTVPVRGELTFHINPVGGLAGGGFTIKLNPVGLLVPLQAGGVKEENESENPKLPYPSPGKANPKVFFDMTVCGKPVGRIVMELFADTTPRTADNFCALCIGEKDMGKKGDFTDERKGCGGKSIYGGSFFEDENFIKKHIGPSDRPRPGIISMNNRGPDTNESQFIICLTENQELDDVHVVFGQVVEGLDVVRIISKEHVRDKLSRPVVIADCGLIS
ncbi:hypothetical protein BRARA_A02802 [Brassica rapa]|uniref:Peptidyl-prolyl cis-trans isomerase n=1 Tax=Brassica campestris TaxID=3711 RepID=A0A398AQW3_BRACM|nr:hypothetical protein BRARA_A02802 [Brassica rapa]